THGCSCTTNFGLPAARLEAKGQAQGFQAHVKGLALFSYELRQDSDNHFSESLEFQTSRAVKTQNNGWNGQRGGKEGWYSHHAFPEN
ncbi:hypothetical protein SERLA73DRAFT_183424, partial [Serpula lacrymans var. lacrymans S7.3]